MSSFAILARYWFGFTKHFPFGQFNPYATEEALCEALDEHARNWWKVNRSKAARQVRENAKERIRKVQERRRTFTPTPGSRVSKYAPPDLRRIVSSALAGADTSGCKVAEIAGWVSPGYVQRFGELSPSRRMLITYVDSDKHAEQFISLFRKRLNRLCDEESAPWHYWQAFFLPAEQVADDEWVQASLVVKSNINGVVDALHRAALEQAFPIQKEFKSVWTPSAPTSPEGVNKPKKSKAAKISLNEEAGLVTVNGQPFRLNGTHAVAFIKLLLEKRGKSVKAGVIERATGVRPDKVFPKLPPPIRDLIMQPGRGKSSYILP